MNEIQRYLVEEELEAYRDGWISRREFLRRAALLGAGAATALTMARSVQPAPARAAPAAQLSPFHVSEDDPSVATERVWYTSTDGVQIEAYLAWPANALADRSLPGVAICHENRGLDPGKLTATGYCAGGGVIWDLTTVYPDLGAAAPFYGGNPPRLDAVPHIQAAVFGVFGELDTRVNAYIPDLEAALEAADVTYRIKIYPNSRHAFHNDPRTDGPYNPETAVEAWIDTLNWFAEHLGLEPPTIEIPPMA